MSPRLRPLALLLAGALASAPATAGRIEMTAEEHAQCEAEGGCIVITMQYIRNLMRESFDAGTKSCSASNRT